MISKEVIEQLRVKFEKLASDKSEDDSAARKQNDAYDSLAHAQVDASASDLKKLETAALVSGDVADLRAAFDALEP